MSESLMRRCKQTVSTVTSSANRTNKYTKSMTVAMYNCLFSFSVSLGAPMEDLVDFVFDYYMIILVYLEIIIIIYSLKHTYLATRIILHLMSSLQRDKILLYNHSVLGCNFI